MLSPTDDEVTFLYNLIAACNLRLNKIVHDGHVDVTWKGLAQFEQRCFFCGLWIDTNTEIAAIKVDSGMSSTKYVHKECLPTDEPTDPSSSVEAAG